MGGNLVQRRIASQTKRTLGKVVFITEEQRKADTEKKQIKL